MIDGGVRGWIAQYVWETSRRRHNKQACLLHPIFGDVELGEEHKTDLRVNSF